MSDLLAGISIFDGVTFVVIVVSAFMALTRGFLRELATLGAFVAAIAAAYFARLYLRDTVASLIGESAPGWAADLIVVVAAFLLVYVLVAWWGGKLSQNVQGLSGLGLLDRLAGLVFGAARGIIAMIFFVVLLQLALPGERIPSWIQDAKTYPLLSDAAEVFVINAPTVASDVREDLPNLPQTDN